MSTIGDVHVGDSGTRYKAKIQDNGVSFDPSTASIKQLIFWTPAGILTKSATVTTEGSDFFLNYSLVYPTDISFHALPGVYQWQGYVVFPDGQRYHTNIERFVVAKNIA